jgi:3-dehydroquinate synthase
MVLAAALSADLGLVTPDFAQRLNRVIEAAGLPVVAPHLPGARWLELMRLDKKAAAGEIRFVLIDTPGRASVRSAPDAMVLAVIERHSAT